MLLTIDFPRVGTGFAISRIPKALRFVLYLNNIKKLHVRVYEKALDNGSEKSKHVYKQGKMDRYYKQIK